MRNGQIHQPIALCVTDEISVRAKQVDGPFDFIGNALAGWLRFAPKLQVLKAIVVALPVQVMDILGVVERSSDVLFHNIAVLKTLASVGAVLIRKPKSDVPLSSNITARFSFLVRAKSLPLRALKFLSAFRAANFYAAILCSAVNLVVRVNVRRGIPFNRNILSTDNAYSGSKSFPEAHTFTRAVEWVFAKLLAVLTKFARAALKFFGANGAVEFHPLHNSKLSVVGRRAVRRAKLTTMRRDIVEGLTAVFALNFHDPLGVIVSRNQPSTLPVVVNGSLLSGAF